MAYFTKEAQQGLKWWIEESQSQNGGPVQTVTTDVAIQTDALKLGWGPYVECKKVSVNSLQCNPQVDSLTFVCPSTEDKHLPPSPDKPTLKTCFYHV